MDRLKQKLYAFMQGRYGTDDLHRALMILWLIFWILRLITQSLIADILAWICLVISVSRALSRDHIRRRAENDRFLRLLRSVKTFCKTQWLRIRECRTAVYRKCPTCGAMLRLPHRRGKHTAVCPRCARRFEVTILF